jgi:hypothetical protein
MSEDYNGRVFGSNARAWPSGVGAHRAMLNFWDGEQDTRGQNVLQQQSKHLCQSPA